MLRQSWGPTTLGIHAGREHNPTRSVITPLFQTTVFSANDPFQGVEHRDFDRNQYYLRWGSPNLAEAEAVCAALEEGEAALLTASGMAAVQVLLHFSLQPGDHLVAPVAIYSGTEQLFRYWEAHQNLSITWIEDPLDLSEWEYAIQPRTKLLWVETPSNPTMAITDIQAIAALGRQHGISVVADNTFATPLHTKPLNLGCRFSVSSATKYLAGHSDVMAGVLVGSHEDIHACREAAILLGPAVDPFAAWLLHRGLKTMALRVRRASSNAEALAQWLLWQPQVHAVYYPSIPTHPGHEVAARQMTDGFGAMVCFELLGGLKAAKKFVDALQLIIPAVSLGGVESLIQHPASSTHAKVSPEIRAKLGITDGLMRLSVGIEDLPDLLGDLQRGLDACLRKPSVKGSGKNKS